VRNQGPGAIRPQGPGSARGPPRARHTSPAPFGPRGGAIARPPGPFSRQPGAPSPGQRHAHRAAPAGGREGAPAPGAYPHPRENNPKQESEEEDIEKRNNKKPKNKNRKKSGSNIITVEEDETVEGDVEKVAPTKLKEVELLFAQEAAQENNAEKPEDFKPSEAVLEFLAGKYLYPLAHKSSKFPRARWFCRLCEYHCDNLVKCREHYLDTRHSRLTRTKEVETTLYHLPRPNKHHLDCLNSLLAMVEKEQGLSSSDLNTRQAVAQSVHSLLQDSIPGCTVRLYGSSLTGFGLKTANVNLDLQITADQKPHLALLKALEVLQESAEYLEVTDEFTAKIPTIKFTTTSHLACELSLNNHHAYQTSRLLKDYWSLDSRVRTVGVAFRYWASLVRLDRQAEGTLPPHTFAILLMYFLQQQTKPVVPCIHDYLDPSIEDVYISPAESLAGWRTQNKMSPAELWIELFAFLSIGFKSAELVVSIRKSGMLTNEEKQWKTKRLAVEDPFSSKRNLCRSIQAGSVYDYIADCLKTGYLYFGTIQTSLGPIVTRILLTSPGDEGAEDEVSLSDWTLESWLAKKGTVLSEKEASMATALVPRNMLNFTFNQSLLTNGTVPAVQCLVCGVEGHLPSSCPEEQLPPLAQLPQLPHPYVRLLDSVCEMVARDWEPQEPELRDRDYIINDLNRYIKKLWPKAELTLFGSSSNGFAFRHSDLDISLTFRDVPDSSNLDCISLIEELSEKIKRMVGMRNVVAITSAKVPIVKLFHHQCQIEADISLYNVLARENTRLLSLYADLDPRCRTLGYMVKLFAKICDIGDASRGSLSSYAYILMMIFYLQKVSPPVLPVLQELHPVGTEKPENLVDGWNAWFYSDRRRVVSEWAGYNRNRMSLGELWIGFLNFYAGDWDDKRLVVSIKQARPLTKFEKMWNSPCIAIEDPFELSHNLGAGISRKMNLYIKKAFINGRKLFGTPFKQNPPGYRTIQDYFFDPELLTDGAPPNDRGCRACGKIGHLVADCPRKKAADQRKKQAKDRQRSLSEQPEKPGGQPQPGVEGGRNRTRSEIPPPPPGKSEQREPTGQDHRQNEEKAPDYPQEATKPDPRDQVPCVPQPTGLPRNVQPAPTAPLPFSVPPPARGMDIGVLAALAGPHTISPEMQAQMQRQMAELLRIPQRQESPAQYDLAALAHLSGQGVQRQGEIVGAINAEDLEASFHTEDSVDSGVEGGDERQAGRPPPGFGGQQQLQEILGQIGNTGQGGAVPSLLQQQMLQRHHEQLLHGVVPGITPEQLRKGGILPEQLRAGGILPEQLRTGAILPEQLRAGGILPEQLQAGGILPGQLRPPVLPGYSMPRQVPGDPLGIQSLANMVPQPLDHQGQGSPNPFAPMMFPMIPFGLPQMGMFPFGAQNPAAGPMKPMGLMRGGLPPTPARESPTDPPHTVAPPLQAGWPSMFGPLSTGPGVPPFTNRETGFPSSVLFPGDLKHPLLHPATPPLEHYLDPRLSPLTTNGSNPLPIPPTSKPITPDLLLAEGSPMTPPNLNLHTFNFDD
jgi:terminal uridylyltransferase